MNKFQPLNYLKKHVKVIIAFFLLLTLLLYVVLSTLQTYTATIIVDYVYSDAENGLAPDGTELDTTEIYSSSVISQALNNLELDQSRYPIDQIRNHITVEQIADEAVDAVNEAKNKEGETSELQSTQYRISYEVKGSEGADMAQTVLDEIVDVYFTQFSRQYVNTVSVVNSTSGLNAGSYDYLEQIEIIENALSNTIDGLESRVESSPNFYSVTTGYSFYELTGQFELLQKTEVSSLYAYILKHRVTEDKAALLDKYRERVQSNKLEQMQNKARVSEVEGILSAYVEKLRESNNTAKSQVIGNDGNAFANSNVLGDVETPNYSGEDNNWVAYDQTTEYEKLLQNWIDISDAYNDSVIDEGYSQYVIDCYEGNSEAVIAYQKEVARLANQFGADAELSTGEEEENVEALQIQEDISADIYTEATVPCTQKDIEYVKEEIAHVLDRMDRLYDIAALTDIEYNEYLGAEYIQILSSNHVAEGLNVMLITALGAVLLLGVGCIGVILLGRIGDIVEYIAFADHQFHMHNRAACDRYIQRNQEKVLPADYAVLLFQVVNQNEINQQLGRIGGDEVLNYFAANLKAMFKTEKSFVGYNGGNQFMIFVPDISYETMVRSLENLQILLDEKYKEKHIVYKYTAGAVLSSREEIYQLRGLISVATKQKKEYEAGRL